MDIEQLYQDYSVDYLTEGHKHCRPGWVNTECPYCEGNAGYHLGYNVHDNFYTCWRCGWHPTVETLAILTRLPEREVRALIRRYGVVIDRSKATPAVRINSKYHKLPSGVSPLLPKHRAYLERRLFDPDALISTWKLLATGPVSRLDGIDYKHRIIIPFIWNGQQVSFDSRDITGRHTAKYMACPSARELIPHKDILYGRQELWTSVGICVEGPTDVWRFGVHSFATSGIKYTPQQVRVIAKTFKRVIVCFDGGEPQALAQANKLVSELRFRNVDARREDITGDPGDMSQTEADYLVKQLIK